ncbi:hypothetical protein JTB14_014895 [Gonioctena quinquepunctata]|nr:hypothetical protein JTB14_014895 [Gonioctena quinquepunctata]
MQHARHKQNSILAGDINIKSILWNAGFTDVRDLTLSSQGTATKVSRYKVSTEENMSLHRTIFFNISTSGGQRKIDWYPTRHLNKAVFTTAHEITEGNI